MKRVATRALVALGGVVLVGSGLAAPAVAVTEPDAPQFGWELLDSGSVDTLSTLDAVSADVAWVGTCCVFSGGALLRTVDGGETFTDVAPLPGLDYIDIEAVDADVALVLALGETQPSTIFRTTDGGASWTETFRTRKVALDCMAMFDRRHGIVVGDPVDGKFQILATADGGRSWDFVDDSGMPAALEGEFAGAFGGDCLTATGRSAFFGTVADPPRVFRSHDRGMTWDVVSTSSFPVAITKLDFRTNKLGLAEGVGRTTDGGATWELLSGPGAPPARLGFAWWSDQRGDERLAGVPDAQKTVFGVVSDDGSWVSVDRGKTWQQFSAEGFYNVDCAEATTACWASGFDGRIAKLTVD